MDIQVKHLAYVYKESTKRPECRYIYAVFDVYNLEQRDIFETVCKWKYSQNLYLRSSPSNKVQLSIETTSVVSYNTFTIPPQSDHLVAVQWVVYKQT